MSHVPMDIGRIIIGGMSIPNIRLSRLYISIMYLVFFLMHRLIDLGYYLPRVWVWTGTHKSCSQISPTVVFVLTLLLPNKMIEISWPISLPHGKHYALLLMKADVYCLAEGSLSQQHSASGRRDNVFFLLKVRHNHAYGGCSIGGKSGHCFYTKNL